MSNLGEAQPLSIFGVNGTLSARIARPDAANLFHQQKWKSESRPFSGYGKNALIRAEIRFDDQCKNGKASFAITGEIYIPGRRDVEACGCLHDEIAKAFPELAHLIRWHLFDYAGPMHYAANAIYLAGDRDCHGGDSAKPCWILRDEKGELPPGAWSNSYHGAIADAPPAPALSWQPMERIGEGKERQLDTARSVAVWPDATDEQLIAEPDELRAMLEARLPALIENFRADVLATGLLWSPVD